MVTGLVLIRSHSAEQESANDILIIQWLPMFLGLDLHCSVVCVVMNPHRSQCAHFPFTIKCIDLNQPNTN